jgi:hypothetical protein
VSALIDVRSLLRSLAFRRPVFHSEADFQHELAWQIRQEFSGHRVRLEVPSGIEGVGTTDLIVKNGETICGLELKYLVKFYAGVIEGETFSLRAHSAHDQRRYDVVKDILRLERLNREISGPSYVVVLTNDPAFWKESPSKATVDAAFRIGNGRTVEGTLAWSSHAGAGTIRGREAAINLSGRYDLAWEDYHKLQGTNGEFRFLAIEIRRPA